MSRSRSTGDWAKLFEGEVAIQAPLVEPVLAAIPARRGVFLLEDPAGKPILLATAADIRARMRFRLAPATDEKPSKRVDLREVAARVRWKLSYSHFETDWHFLELARAIYPDTYVALLSFQPAWFVHVDLQEATPFFRRTREVLSGHGRYFGPFPDKHAAQRFIEIVQDVFELCRCEPILRRAPDGAPCVYAQMGRCRAPCAGNVSMDEYRRQLAEACRCAEGRRGAIRDSLDRQMRRLAAGRQYERAALCKTRLDRLAELEGREYRHVAAAERFQYLLVQRGAGPRQASVFLVDRGFVRKGPPLAYPLRAKQLEAAIGSVRKAAARERKLRRPERYRIGLVSRYLFGNAERRGLMVRVDEDLTAEALAGEIDSMAAKLKLRAPGGGKSKSPDSAGAGAKKAR